MNVEELCGKPVKFRDWIFFTLVCAFFIAWAYQMGAGDYATGLSKYMPPALLGLTIGYCLFCYFRYRAYIRHCQRHYDHFLKHMSQKELKRLLKDTQMSPLSRVLLTEHYQKRFEKTKLGA